MTSTAVSSWRELDGASSDTDWCCHDHRVHSTLVFRGLSRATFRNIWSLARLTGDYPSLEPHPIRNPRQYAHRERPGPTLRVAPPRAPNQRPPNTAPAMPV